MKMIRNEDKIFIAGSTGMVGGAIYKILKLNGYGSPKKGGKLLKPNRNQLNLLNTEKVNLWFKKNHPDIVILAAAKVGGIFANNKYPASFLLENTQIQNNVIEASYKYGVRRLMFLGSSCIYPKDAKQPIKEEYLLEGALEKTNECYAIAKISGIMLCKALRAQNNFDAICLMPTNVYGPGDNYHPKNSHVMAALIKKFCEAERDSIKEVTCWGTGKPLREFIYVDDLAKAVLFALEKWDPNSKSSPKDKDGEPLIYLNVGTGNDISIKNLAKKIAFASNYEGRIQWDHSMPDGTFRKQLDVSRINKIGWYPEVNLDQGIEKTVSLYKSNYF